MVELGPPLQSGRSLPKVACLFSLHVWPADWGGKSFSKRSFSVDPVDPAETFLIYLFQILVTERYQMTRRLFLLVLWRF